MQALVDERDRQAARASGGERGTVSSAPPAVVARERVEMLLDPATPFRTLPLAANGMPMANRLARPRSPASAASVAWSASSSPTTPRSKAARFTP